jgi:antitoxin ChpS
MEVVLRKVGNSTAVVVPPPVLRGLGMAVGQRLTLATTPDGKIILTPKNKYRLADLVAQCNPKMPPPADLALWDEARPVGQEAW